MRKISKTATIGSIAVMSAVFVASAISTNVKVRDTSDEIIYFESGSDYGNNSQMESLATLSSDQYDSYVAQSDKFLGANETTKEETADSNQDKVTSDKKANDEVADKKTADKKVDKKNTSNKDTQSKAEAHKSDKDDNKSAQKEEKKSEFDSVAISKANPYVNVRDSASENGNILGKLYKGCIGTIVGTEGEWVKIKSGSVTGFVKSEFVISGEEAQKVYSQYTTKVATVTTQTLRVRSEASTTSSIITQVAGGEKFDVISEKDGWVKIDAKGDLGYVSADYLKFSYDYETAISIEEEEKAALEARKAEEEALRKEAEEKVKKEAEEKAKLEAQKKEEKKEQADKAMKDSTKQPSNEAVTVTGSGMSYTEEDLKLLACLVYTEAGGEPYASQLAVANVVLNRVKSSRYPNTISGVIYQSGQFGPARNGALARRLKNYTKSGNSYKAAKAALEGDNNIGDRMGFNSVHATSAHSNDIIMGVIRFF